MQSQAIMDDNQLLIEDSNRNDKDYQSIRGGTTEVPLKGVCVSWKSITATVKAPKKICSSCTERDKIPETKTILNEVSGIVQPGTHMTFIGSSGSGKTTLFNVLNHRNLRDLTVEGEVRYNGHIVGKDISNFSAYIQQEDLFMGGLTVQEHLWFYVCLLADRHLTDEERQMMIDHVAAELNLRKCLDTVIGVHGGKKGLSGGEKKRLAFATAVLTSPQVIFCDEPTSGLDSYMAMGVMQVLTNMAKRGRTILSTLHQPSSEIYDMMDQLYVMAEGRTVYSGPANTVVDYFSTLGHHCPVNYNPADYVVFQIAVDKEHEAESRAKTQVLCDVYRNSDEHQECMKEIDNQEALARYQSDPESSGLKGDTYSASYLSQLSYLLWRSYLHVYRKRLITVKCLQMLVVGFIMGLLYFGQPINQSSITNIGAVMMLSMSQMSLSMAIVCMQAFGEDRLVFLREYHNKMYGAVPFYLSKVIVDVSVFFWMPFVYFIMSYWMVGLSPHAVDYFVIMLGGSALVSCVTAVAHCISSLTDSMSVRALMLQSTLVLFLQFIPFLMADGSRYFFLKPFEWLSPYKYVFEIWTITEWRHVEEIACASNSSTCWESGYDVIVNLYGMDIDAIPTDFLTLLAIFIAFEIAGMLSFVVRARKDR